MPGAPGLGRDKGDLNGQTKPGYIVKAPGSGGNRQITPKGGAIVKVKG